VEGDTLGSLNLYSTRADAFDANDVAVGAVFATHASVAWSNSRLVGNLKAGMATRELVGEAIGILMARQHISDVEAFAVLKRASQRLNIKLNLIAQQVVHPPEDAPST
jgi:GAF domain-containing protein